MSCTEFPGVWGDEEIAEGDRAPDEQLEHGYLGGLSLPSAAIQGREVEEVIRIALAWDNLERIARSHGICPRCAAQVERRLTVCENHDASEGPCEACGSRDRVRYRTNCPNCPYAPKSSVYLGPYGYTPFLDFITSHGFNPVTMTVEQNEVLSDA